MKKCLKNPTEFPFASISSSFKLHTHVINKNILPSLSIEASKISFELSHLTLKNSRKFHLKIKLCAKQNSHKTRSEEKISKKGKFLTQFIFRESRLGNNKYCFFSPCPSTFFFDRSCAFNVRGNKLQNKIQYCKVCFPIERRKVFLLDSQIYLRIYL